VGTLAAGAATALWLFFAFRNPYAAGPLNDAQVVFSALVILTSALAAVAAALGAHLAMYLLFFVLFVPAGFYVMLSGGIFGAIGYLDLVYLGAAMAVHRAVRNQEPGTGNRESGG
jgi:hypothetical protein